MDYHPFEIIVVDDSIDQTPEIVLTYSNRGIRLIHREKNTNGCCGARNLGMKMARGEFIVLLNADDLPQADFLRQLLVHYESGADFVISRSVVANRETIWGKYIYAGELETLKRGGPIAWSEGFSVRRRVAEKVGYIPGDYPVPFCRDHMFGKELQKASFKKHVALEIEMKHVVPDKLSAFWRNRVWRGTMSSPYSYFMRKKSFLFILARESLKALRNIFLRLTIFPQLWRAMALSRNLKGGIRTVLDVFIAGTVEDMAMIVGNFKGLVHLSRSLRTKL
jgi:glycosyltransferase involved in cell wall biosynthesis